jgi:hypothetical protein
VLTFTLRLAAAFLSFVIGFASYQAYGFCLSYLGDESVSAEGLSWSSPDEGIQHEKVQGCGDSPLRATQAILERARVAASKKEPQWEYIAGICDCPPFFPDERKVIDGSWEQKGGTGTTDIHVGIHEVGSCEGLAGWLGRLTRGGKAWGRWNAEKYDLGDEAYLLTQSDERKISPNYELYVRVNNLLVEVGGNSLPDVERFAKYVVAEIHAD